MFEKRNQLQQVRSVGEQPSFVEAELGTVKRKIENREGPWLSRLGVPEVTIKSLDSGRERIG